LSTDQETRSACRRFLEGFCQRNNFSIDRFLGAANSFELLPNGSFMARQLARDAESFVRDTRCKARKLSDASLREQALSMIGRLGATSLTDKILQRYDSLPEVLRVITQGAHAAIRQAVRIRNYFVHGADPLLPREAVFEFLPFFTNLIEFTFVTAFLVERGWNADRWIKSPSTRCPLRDFLRGFEADTRRLSELG
jgi:hypothetical protein